MKEWQVKTGTGKLPCILRNGCFVAGMGEHRLALKDANELVTAANQHAALLAVAEAAKALSALEISVCPHCDGNGLQYPEPNKDACHTCGGTGEIASPALPQDVKELQQSLATLAQIQKGE